ncbi:MAG: type IV pilus modification PilV family protein [Verrucomicrobiaceae bacterium]
MRLNCKQGPKRGFLLMEVVLALMVFGIMAVGFTKALAVIRKNSMLVGERMQITQIVDSALTETLMLPTLEEGSTVTDIEERDMEILTVIEPMEIETEEGQLLQEMYRVVVTARWYEDGREKQETAEGWRYLRLYKP